MKPPERVVFDCNVLFQAFISAAGPAGELLKAVNKRKLALYLSEFSLDELKDVLSRAHIVAQFKFTGERVAQYFESLVEMATFVADVPHVFDFPRDPRTRTTSTSRWRSMQNSSCPATKTCCHFATPPRAKVGTS